MKNDVFNEVVETRLEKIKKTLNKKAGEYASDYDRLYNFKRQALIKDETQAQSLWGNFTKQLVSVDDMVNKKLQADEKMIDEKIGDCINYLILLEGVFKEELQFLQTTKKGGTK